MSRGLDPLAGIDTKPYAGRQRQQQDIEQAILAKASRESRREQRDGRLIMAVVVLTCLLAGSVLGNVIQGLLGVRVEPYLIMVDHLGTQSAPMRLSEVTITAEQSHVFGKLMDWVEWVRMISSDAVVMSKVWERVSEYTSHAGMNMLEAYRTQQKERQQQGKRVQVSKPQVQHLSGSRSYHVEWDECTFTHEGRLILEESAYWKATLTVADFQGQAAKKARELRLRQKNYRNILGIVVDDIKWEPRPFATMAIAQQRCGGL